MIKVYDDIIPKDLQDYFELITFGKKNTNNYIYPSIDLKIKYENTAVEDEQMPINFVHVLKSSTNLSSHLDNFSHIPLIVCEHLNWSLIDVIAARLFLILPYETKLEHYAPHVDFNIPHKVVLYYINDADGDTVFFNKDGKIIQKVSPKKGRVLVFNGELLHGGGIPKKGPRAVVNFDIII